MRIQELPGAEEEILGAFNSLGLAYDRALYSGLVMPGSVVLDAPTADRLHNDVDTVWSWFANWQRIYQGLVAAGDDTHPLLQASEWGLDALATTLQREAADREAMPLLGRIDSVGVYPNQQIAEVQWKGGGEGFIAAIDATYNDLFADQGTLPLGELATNWGHIFRAAAGHDETLHVLNTGRDIWRNGELFLGQALRQHGIEWSFLPPKEVAEHLTVQAGRLCLELDGTTRPLDFIYLDRLTEVIPAGLLTAMGRAVLDGSLCIDPPISYLFNQKVGLALPFMDEYSHFFDDRIRQILIPSVLVSEARPNCGPIIPSINHQKRALLGEIKTWEDLLKLPRNVREQLVLKCASTHQYNNHGGHGVLRLWGSTRVAQKSLETVLERVRVHGEPWILQPYINETWEVPLGHPDQIDTVERVEAHARFGLYCGHVGGNTQLLGGIATFSPFWKVAGKTAGRDGQNKLTGSAFTHMRVAR